MVAIAKQIISQAAGPFDPSHFVDRYEEALKALIAQKQQERVIAGLHYPKDNKAGVKAAELCYEMLKNGAKFLELLESAKKELYAGGKARNSTRPASADLYAGGKKTTGSIDLRSVTPPPTL